VIEQVQRQADWLFFFQECREFIGGVELVPVAKIVAPMKANHGAEGIELFAGVRCILIRKDVYEVALIFY
jgi:hypothetical protein